MSDYEYVRICTECGGPIRDCLCIPYCTDEEFVEKAKQLKERYAPLAKFVSPKNAILDYLKRKQ